MSTPLIGIMQGRLFPPVEGRFQCFPRDRWAEEFPRAAEAGMGCIEWIYDLYGADVNPLATDAGIDTLKSLSAKHGVAIRSVCADYFMDRPFLRTSGAEVAELVGHLHWLLGRCQVLGIRHVVLPFVDNSRIESAEEESAVIELLNQTIPAAVETSVELHLETSLPPDRFAAMLARIPNSMVAANYDSGNSSSLGYRPREEFAAYGDRIGSIHIKDRKRGGGTVPLGTGDADLPALFDCVKAIGYDRHFIMQVARGTPGDEVEWSRNNLAIVRRLMAEADSR